MKPEMIIRAANGELEGAGALALSANGAEVVLVRAAGDGAPSKTAARIRAPCSARERSTAVHPAPRADPLSARVGAVVGNCAG